MNRAPPDAESVKELWEYQDVLDLKTVFTWCNEVGIKRGVLYEDGKVEFDEWPLPPHEYIIDLFEIIFRRQFISLWPNDLNPTFDGIHSQGEDTLFLENYINDTRYKLPWEKKTTRQFVHPQFSTRSEQYPPEPCSIAANLWITLANHRPRSRKF